MFRPGRSVSHRFTRTPHPLSRHENRAANLWIAKWFAIITLGIIGLLACFAAAIAQNVPAPQIGLSGNVGAIGFPILNSGTFQMPADADVTFAGSNVNTSAFAMKVTSAVSLTTTRNLIYPAGRFYVTVENATTGGQAIQIIGPTGTGVAIANGRTVTVWNDGTNYVTAAGATGPAGPTGPTGPTGATGPAGPNLVNNSTSTPFNGLIQGNGTTTLQSDVLPSDTTATTQSPGDTSTKVATDAFVLANAGANPCTVTAGATQYDNAGSFGCAPPVVVTTYAQLTAAIAIPAPNILIPVPITLTAALTVPAGTCISFNGTGELTGAYLVTFQGCGPTAPHEQQIFASATTLSFPAGTQTWSGWFGVVHDGSTDTTTALTKAASYQYTNLNLPCGTYIISSVWNVYSNVFGCGELASIRAGYAYGTIIKSSSATATIFNPENAMTVELLLLDRSVLPTPSGTTGIGMVVPGLSLIQGVASNNSNIGFYHNGDGGNRILQTSCLWTLPSYTSSTTAACHKIVSGGGSIYISDTGDNGQPITSVFGTAYDVWMVGSVLSDVQVDLINDGYNTHSVFIDASSVPNAGSCSGGLFSCVEDIHIMNPTMDACVGACVEVLNATAAKAPSISIGGSGSTYMVGQDYAFDIENSSGVTVSGCAGCEYFEINNSTNIQVINNQFPYGYGPSTISGSTGINVSNNDFFGYASYSIANLLGVTTTTQSSFNGNNFHGTATTTATFDSSSTTNNWIGNTCAAGSSFGSGCTSPPTNLVGAAASALGPGSTIGGKGLAGSGTSIATTNGSTTLPTFTNTLGCLQGFDTIPCAVANIGVTSFTAAQGTTTLYTTPASATTGRYRITAVIQTSTAGTGAATAQTFVQVTQPTSAQFLVQIGNPIDLTNAAATNGALVAGVGISNTMTFHEIGASFPININTTITGSATGYTYKGSWLLEYLGP